MTEAEKAKKNPCGSDKEIDEYLDGTICEVLPDEAELNDIKTPEDDDFDVHAPDEKEEILDEYIGKVK